ncbi:hypothetical protein [Niallia taxi]|uniref:hypothetical protein n=1 Tax=Niallia taxi TaxID=2499688 RepID=UPI0011A5497E|nr:hypothetical protein [Niallia taxi]MCT2344081.1 hypothetical protein [Niallia taxi]MDE5051288.1 hypothetical protein [Niallia taxi]
MLDLSVIPIPFFQIDSSYFILARSEASNKMFASADNFLELIDKESLDKTITFLKEMQGTKSIEVNMKTSPKGLAIFNIQYTYDSSNELFYVLCHCIDHQYTNISFELNQLRDSLLHLQSGQDIKTMSTTMTRDEKSLDKLNNIETRKKLDKIKRSTSTVIDLLGITSPLIIEGGKGEYLEMLYDELYEIKTIVDQMKKTL